METFGQRLRRLRTEAGYSQSRLATLVPISQASLSRYEADRQAVEDPAIAARLDELLDARGDLVQLQSPTVLHGPGTDHERLAHVAHRPRLVDGAALDVLADTLASTRQLEDAIGAAPVLGPERGHVDLMASLAAEARGPIRRRVVDLAGQWAQHYAWLHTALGRFDEADRWFSRALEWALEAEDDDLAATVWSFKGHVAWLRGDVGPTIGLTQVAQRYQGIHAGQSAYDALQEARGHAITGDTHRVEQLVDDAQELADLALDQLRAGAAPPWHYYRSPAFWDLERGRALAPVRPERAVKLLTAGLDELPADQLSSDWAASYRRDLAAAQRLCG